MFKIYLKREIIKKSEIIILIYYLYITIITIIYIYK